MVATRDAHQRVAAIDDVNARRRCRQRRPACWPAAPVPARRGNGRGLARNDQLLTGRQRARPLVAIGLQDRGGGNVVARRQNVERVAGADDDRGAACAAQARGRDRSRRDACRWSRAAAGSAARRTTARALLPTRHCSRPDRTAAPPRRAAARPRTGIATAALSLRPCILRQLAALDGGRAAPSRWLRAGRQRDWRRSFAKAASDISALQPAKPTDISASTATCGTRRERSNSTTRDMVTHSYATKYCFE